MVGDVSPGQVHNADNSFDTLEDMGKDKAELEDK